MSMVTTAVCKSLQSLGLSPRKEHQIENTLVNQLRSSGPEFVLSRMSELSDWRKMHIVGKYDYKPAWHKYRTTAEGVTVPTDRIGSQLWGLSDRAFYACVGAITKSIELSIPSDKQLSKWVEGVRCKRMSSQDNMPFKASMFQMMLMEESLRKKWTARPWFNVSDISGTNIPGSGKFMSVKVNKDSTKDPMSLINAYRFSVSTTPLFIWQFLKDINAPDLMSDGIDNPDDFRTSLEGLIEQKLNSAVLQDEAEFGNSFLSDEEFLSQRGKYYDAQLGFLHSVGNIGFLQQGKGKLRTVANPNRLVQYCNIPLGEVLGQLFYHKDGCFVLNQQKGIQWAQRKLREGVELSSFDMSAATDRLDYRKFIHEYFHEVYSSGRYPLLQRSLELFEDTSSGVWSIPGHIADLIGANDTKISWSVGQPLGLRPSFPLLTIMNSKFAEAAIRDIDGIVTPGHYACVGDDLVIESKYADRYMEWVSCYNGKINNEKSLVSDRVAEFCSQMITKGQCFPLKPRFIQCLDASLENIEKFSTPGLKPRVPSWSLDLYRSISKFHLDGFNAIKYSQSSTPSSLDERLGANTLIKALNPALRDLQQISLNSLYYRALDGQEKLDDVLQVSELASSSASDAYKSFSNQPTSPTVDPAYKRIWQRVETRMGEISTDKTTSVVLPMKRSWDYKSDSYQKPSSSVKQARKLHKQLSSISVSSDDDLITAAKTDSGITTRVYIDTRPERPETLITVSKDSGPEMIINDNTDDLIPDETIEAIHARRVKQLESLWPSMKVGGSDTDLQLDR